MEIEGKYLLVLGLAGLFLVAVGLGWLPPPGADECPEGYFWDEEQGVCLRPITTTPPVTTPPVTTPPTTTSPPEGTECPEGYVWDETEGFCRVITTPPTTVECPEGYWYDPEQGEHGACRPITRPPTTSQEVPCPEGQYRDYGGGCRPIPEDGHLHLWLSGETIPGVPNWMLAVFVGFGGYIWWQSKQGKKKKRKRGKK